MNTGFPANEAPSLRRERESLARESDPELRASGLLSLAGREQAQGRSEAAAAIYANLLQETDLPESIRRRAQDRLGALRGDGPVGARAEVLLQRLTQEATEPTALFAMGVAGATFKLTRFLTLSRLAASPTATLLTRGFGARALAGGSAFAAEAAVFPLAGRLGAVALGRELDWSPQTLGHELLSSGLTLGSLRSGGWLMGQAGRWAGGGVLASGALAQAGMFGGILLSRRLEEGLGLRESLPGATVLTDGLATLLQFNMAARLSRSAFGERFARWEQSLESRSQSLGRNLSLPQAPQDVPALAAAGTGVGRPSRAFDLNVFMAQSHDPGNPGADSGPRASERPTLPGGAPAESNGGAESTPVEAVQVRARPLTPLIVQGSEAVRQEGETWQMEFQIGRPEAQAYREALDLEAAVEHAPSGMTFAKAFPAIVAATQAAMQRAPRPTVIHGVEEIQYREPLRFGESLRLEVTRKIRGSEGKPQQVFLERKIFRVGDGEGARPAVTAKSALLVGPEMNEVKPTTLPVAEREALPEPRMVLEVTPELIDAFCRGSGDFNPVHVSDQAAQELGLPGRILHGMATFNYAEHVWRQNAAPAAGPVQLKVAFRGIARPGDNLSFHLRPKGEGSEVLVLNQRNEKVLTLEAAPSPAPKAAAVEVPATITGTYGKTLIEVQSRAGWDTVQRIRAKVAPFVPQLREALGQRIEQPWFIAGVSDGMGLYSTVALMEAGVRHMVGGFYEPEALLKAESEIHLGRLANVEGLRFLAAERGLRFARFYEDLVLPQHGQPDKALPGPVRIAIREAQNRAWIRDLNFINSIAFARWISPSPGVEQLKGIPSLDAQGRVILMDMKAYNAKNYEGTLDSMGRNHGSTLEALTPHFGPRSTSFFFTWAGGSQNPKILRGVYGGGALGHAKEIGETATLRYHLRSEDGGFDRGYHKIVRFPDFPSFALFGIPGGGGFGMIARHTLEGHGAFADIGELAPRAYIEAFGGEHNLRNAAAQIELDVPESYHLPQIAANLQEFHRRVADYRTAHPEWTGKPLDAETSAGLLHGLVSPDYVRQIPKATE